MLSRLTISSSLCVLALTSIFISPASAQGIDASGTYKGTATENIVCGSPTPGTGVRNLSVVMVVTGNSNGSFSAATSFDGLETFNGVTQPFSNQASPFIGTVAADGNTVAEFQAVPPIVTTGTLSGNTWTLGYVAVGPVCTFTLNMVIVRGSVVPAESPSGLITGSATLLSSTRAISSLQQVRIGSLFSGRAVGASKAANGFLLQGMAAGDEASIPFGVWGSYSRSNSKNNFQSIAFKSDRYTVLGGVDIMPVDWVVVGLAAGLENTDVNTRFNGGELSTDGYTAAPYLALLLSDRLLVDASVGLTTLSTNQFRTSVSGTGASSRVTSNFNSLRRFFTLNASYGFEFDSLFANANVGYLWAKETQPDYVESNGTQISTFAFRIAQIHVGGDVAYSLGAFEPYARLTYERDISATEVRLAGGLARPETDDSGLVSGLGLRYFNKNGLTGQLEYSRIFGRKHFREGLYSVVIRAEF